jgi:hypothetical protein
MRWTRKRPSDQDHGAVATNLELEVQSGGGELLARYAADELGVSLYDCAQGSEEGALFLASLQSTRSYLELGRGRKNGRGVAFSANAVSRLVYWGRLENGGEYD